MRAVSTAVPGSAAKLTRMAGGGDSRRFRVQHDRPEEERDPGDKRGESEEGSAGAVPRHSVRGPPCSLLSFRPLSPQLVSQQPLHTSTDLLSGSEETGLPISRKRLRDSILNIIVAGRESVLSPVSPPSLIDHRSTTAQGLSWTFFRLLQSPSLLAPLRTEVDSLGEVTYRNYKVSPSLPRPERHD